MDVKGILFDLDGVLLKSMEQHLEAWQFAFKDCGVRVEADDFYQLEGRGVKSVVNDLTDRFGITRTFGIIIAVPMIIVMQSLLCGKAR